MAPIRLALIGAGIFARDAHLPAIQGLGDTYDVVAVHSRTRAKAEKLAALVGADVVDELDALLARDDIEAVDLVLPISAMPDVIRKALDAGKHIISEKPAAPDITAGRDLLAEYAQHADQIWMVAENWRYESAFTRAAELVQAGEIGRPAMCHWVIYGDVGPDNKYYHTPWRRDSSFQGGFILDGGVHQIAAMRLVLGEIAEVSAVVTQVRDDLPPADTLNAALRFESGLTGMYSITYAAPAPWPGMLHIAGDQGALRVQPGEIEVTTAGGTSRTDRTDRAGVEGEFAAFAAAIREGTSHRNAPEQGMQDVAVIEAMLRSAETGQRVRVERFVG